MKKESSEKKARAVARNTRKRKLKKSASQDCPPGHGTTTQSEVPNPLLAAQNAFLMSLSALERDNFFSNTLDPDRRAEIWANQAALGEDLVNRFSWAIPDERAIRILRHFSPLVEIGSGANAYWCQLMRLAGIDVVAFDARPESGGLIINSSSTLRKNPDSLALVRQGRPEILASRKICNSGRNLFLCYPDEEEETETLGAADESLAKSLGAACLEHYHGQYVIHVGELFGDTLSIEQAPWGRSSSPAFQERLLAEFHCLLKVGLTNWLFSRDTISVWKRSEKCCIVFRSDEDDGTAEEEVQYRHIPTEERLPSNVAAPCVAHLLTEVYPVETLTRVVDSARTDTSDVYFCPW
jgi:hypothetical protein